MLPLSVQKQILKTIIDTTCSKVYIFDLNLQGDTEGQSFKTAILPTCLG